VLAARIVAAPGLPLTTPEIAAFGLSGIGLLIGLFGGFTKTLDE